MDFNSVAGILRAVLPAIAAFAVGKGWVNAGSADWIVSSVIALAAAGWSVWTNRPAAVAAGAQAVAGVNVQTTPAATPAVQAAVAAAKTP